MRKLFIVLMSCCLFACDPTGGKSSDNASSGGGGDSKRAEPIPAPTDIMVITATATATATETATATATVTITTTETATSTPTPSAAGLSISDGVTYSYGVVATSLTSDKTFTITKTGESNAISVTGAGLAAPFSFKGGGGYPGTGGTCGTPISATCTIVVTFAPVSVGSFSDSIEINYNDGYENKQVVRAVSGSSESIWTTRFGSAAQAETPNGSVTDATGNTYIVGSFFGTVNFGGGNVSSQGTEPGTYDAFILKLDYNGNFVWVRTYGSSGRVSAKSIAVDTDGNLIIAGNFQYTIDFVAITLSSNNNTDDMWVGKWNTNGTAIWVKKFGGAWGETAYRVAVNSSKQVYLLGDFQSNPNFGGGVRSTGADTHAGVVIKLDTDGTYMTDMVLPAYANPQQIMIDSSNYVVLTGQLETTIDFGDGNLVPVAGSSNSTWIAKYNSSLVFSWSHSYTSGEMLALYFVTYDDDNNIYLTGSFRSNVSADTVTLTSAGETDIVVIKMDASGTEIWAKRFGGASYDSITNIRRDTAQNIYLLGTFKETVNYGGGNITSFGDSDGFILKINTSGNFVSMTRFGGTQSDTATSIGFDSLNSMFVAGSFAGTAAFPSGSVTSAGSTDIVVFKNIQ